MQITKKLRDDILSALPELTTKQARRIAKKTKVHEVTVWRHWKKLRNQRDVELNDIILAIAELAAFASGKLQSTNQRIAQVQKQLSSARKVMG